MKPWRMFIAIDLPPEVRERLARHINSVRQQVPDARASWTRPDNIHLTLKFLGDVELSRIEELSNATAQAVNSLAPFEIVVRSTGVFPNERFPRVLWIGIEDTQAKLRELYSRLEEECARAGHPKEERPFRPHLTIARLRRSPKNARQAVSRDLERSLIVAHQQTAFEPAEIVVSELLVIRSELGGQGSKYTVVSRHQLQ